MRRSKPSPSVFTALILLLQVLCVSLAAAAEYQVTTDPADEFHAAWSPNDDQIVFTRNEESLWIIPSAGGTPWQLINGDGEGNPAAVGSPSWYGSTIIYNSNQTENNDLFAIPADASTLPVQITTESAYDAYGVWSPNGTEIAFTSNRGGNDDIWVMQAAGGLLRQITTDLAQDNLPTWSPDGSKIAFASDRSGNRDIWVVSALGGTPTQLTNDAGPDDAPSWSNDDYIAFSSPRSGNYDIWAVPATGGPAIQLTSNPAADSGPAWSHDGSKIAFFSRRTGNADIWVMTVTLPPLGLGSITGVVSVGSTPLANVTVDLVADEGQHVQFAFTNSDGAYRFDNVPAGEAPVSLVVPLGYLAVNPPNAMAEVTVMAGQETTQDFVLETQPDAGPVREVNYWKHQARVHLRGHGQAQETLEAMSVTYPNLIFAHFYENQLNSIDVENVTFLMVDDEPTRMTLEAIEATLTPGGAATMHNRAKKQFLALLLNVASNRLRSTDVVSPDGATASQAVQQIARQINDAIASNDANARNTALRLNTERRVPAGWIDLSIPVIPFAPHPSPAAGVLGVAPNPMANSCTFAFELASPGSTTVRVFDVSGRLVRTLLDEQLPLGRHSAVWDARGDHGQVVANGVYFYRIETPDGLRVARLVVMH